MWGCKSQEKVVNVLFVGNSLTYYNGMPQLLQDMLNETDLNIKIDQITFPGVSLESHIDYMTDPNKENSRYEKNPGDTTITEKKVIQKPWDVIVMQEGTVRLLIPEAKNSLVVPAIQKIKSLATNEKCKFIIFHTWASNKAEFPKEYCYSSSIITKKIDGTKFCSERIADLKQEVELIDKAYQSIVKTTSIEKSNNGKIVYNFMKNNPEIKIYADDQHPSVEGAFLNACIFYEMLTEKKAKNLKFNGNIDSKISNIIKNSI